MEKIKFKKAYTLAEVVMALIVIGVILSVTMNVTRVKIDRVIKYTYYAAYTTITDIAAEILVDSEDNSIPASGLCSEFEDRLNLYGQDVDVNGSDVEPSCSYTHSITDSTDFSKLKPNLVARNGMRFYNLNSSASSVSQLTGSSVATLDSTGYTIYIDIDAERGTGKLYKDVFPFYLTRSGKVIPAYPTDDVAGGNSLDEMLFSVRYDTFGDDDTRTENWLLKSVSFKEAACKSGYVSVTTSYCTNSKPERYNSVDENCDEDTEDCILVPIKPIKYLVK